MSLDNSQPKKAYPRERPSYLSKGDGMEDLTRIERILAKPVPSGYVFEARLHTLLEVKRKRLETLTGYVRDNSLRDILAIKIALGLK